VSQESVEYGVNMTAAHNDGHMDSNNNNDYVTSIH